MIETLGCGPEISDAYHGIVEVGMKNRRQHAALWRTPGITEGQIHLKHVRVALQNLSRAGNIEPAQVVSKTINLRWNSGLACDLNQRPILQQTLQCLFIEDETSDTRRRHALRS